MPQPLCHFFQGKRVSPLLVIAVDIGQQPGWEGRTPVQAFLLPAVLLCQEGHLGKCEFPELRVT